MNHNPFRKEMKLDFFFTKINKLSSIPQFRIISKRVSPSSNYCIKNKSITYILDKSEQLVQHFAFVCSNNNCSKKFHKYKVQKKINTV